MRLIVTRPEPAAGITADKLRALGHDVIISPMLEIVDTDLNIPSGNFSAIIITSSNALRVMQRRGIEEILLHTQLYVVGDRTAAKAKEVGFTNVHSASGNAKDLVELLTKHVDLLDGGKNTFLYICGVDATVGFMKDLREIGLNIVEWINYKAILVDQLTNKSIEILRSGNAVGILLYSARTARQFSQVMAAQFPDQEFDNIQLFAISKKVKNALAGPLQKQCLVANRPDESNLINLIPV